MLSSGSVSPQKAEAKSSDSYDCKAVWTYCDRAPEFVYRVIEPASATRSMFSADIVSNSAVPKRRPTSVEYLRPLEYTHTAGEPEVGSFHPLRKPRDYSWQA